MTSSTAVPDSQPQPVLPIWAIWENPIFIRYTRSRLRTQSFAFAATFWLIIAAFFMFGTSAWSTYREHAMPVDAARAALGPLIILQAFILLLIGTGSVASGIAQETDEGMGEYQRLTPLTPLAKVLGYLFGLPVREYGMVALTMPLAAWCIWSGNVPARVWLSVYGVLFTTALLYHSLGLVCGSLFKGARRVGWAAQIIVLFLNFVLPLLSNVGLVLFKYLTVEPTILEHLVPLMPKGTVLAALSSRIHEVRFFSHRLSETSFTWVMQGSIILTFVVMLWRRWRNAESHILGKGYAVGLMIWLQFIMLGNGLPLIESGRVFPSLASIPTLPKNLKVMSGSELLPVLSIYGLVGLLITLLLVTVITPDKQVQITALRRSQKLSLRLVPPFSDGATSFWFALVLSGLAAGGWIVFSRALLASSWAAHRELPTAAFWVLPLVILLPSLCWQSLNEALGKRWAFFTALFGGLTPLLIAVVLAAKKDWRDPAALIGSISPLTAPFTGMTRLLPALAEKRAEIEIEGFNIWLSLSLTACVALVVILVRSKIRQRADSAAQPLPPAT